MSVSTAMVQHVNLGMITANGNDGEDGNAIPCSLLGAPGVTSGLGAGMPAPCSSTKHQANLGQSSQLW
ncbi:MAG: hypothetical protein ACREHG_02190, partial [Candidatus Saccharimonadales bacterium]